ncbi:MAG: hypothetical protein ACO1SV_11485 [Fimbriimonas sp.]
MTPLVALFVVASPAPSAAETFAASARAHAALRRFRVAASVEARNAGKRTRVDYDIVADGDIVRLHIEEAAAPGRARSERTFLFGRTEVVAYDATANERITRPLPTEAQRLGRVIFTLGPVDDLVRFLLDGKQMGEFYGNMNKLTDWKLTKGTGGTTLTRDVRVGNGRNTTTLRFAPRTQLLTALSISTPKSSSRWRIQYLTPSKPTLKVPSTATTVSAFTVAPEPPRFATKAAERSVKAMMRAYGNLRRGVVTVREDMNLTTIALDGARVREENPTVTYAFDGTNLSILDRRRKVMYRGKTARGRIPALVSAMKGRTDPLTRQALQGRLPLRELMVPEMRVSTGGAVVMDGVACEILEFEKPGTRVMLCVRKDNHLLDSLTTTTLDPAGRPLLNTARRFRYQRLGQAQPTAQFSIVKKAGYTVRPLPKLGQ